MGIKRKIGREKSKYLSNSNDLQGETRLFSRGVKWQCQVFGLCLDYTCNGGVSCILLYTVLCKEETTPFCSYFSKVTAIQAHHLFGSTLLKFVCAESVLAKQKKDNIDSAHIFVVCAAN